MAKPPPEILSVADIACRRGDRLVLSNLSFNLRATECLVVRGPNGGGKSTLLRLLAGLLTAQAGRIRDGAEADIGADLSGWRRQISWLGHQDALKPGETPAEAIALRARLGGARADRANDDYITHPWWRHLNDPVPPIVTAMGPVVDKWLAAMGMAAFRDTPVRLLSAGQRRRVALAATMASGGPLWLIDEPTTALDSEGSQLFYAALAAHTSRGGAAVITTHDEVPYMHRVGELVLKPA